MEFKYQKQLIISFAVIIIGAIILSMVISNKKESQKREQSQAKLRIIQERLDAVPSTWPVVGHISSGFGFRLSPWRGWHMGIDIDAKFGAPVRATASGIVVFSGWRQGYGKTIEIKHDNNLSTFYGHNSILVAAVRDKIKKGQIISFVGMTGYTTGPHLHYEVRKYGLPVNPMAYLSRGLMTAGNN